MKTSPSAIAVLVKWASYLTAPGIIKLNVWVVFPIRSHGTDDRTEDRVDTTHKVESREDGQKTAVLLKRRVVRPTFYGTFDSGENCWRIPIYSETEQNAKD